jgi:hypothetical protein
VSNVTISDVTIKQPTFGQPHNITVVTAGNALTWDQALWATPHGTLSNIKFKDIAIEEFFELPVVFSNAPGTYTATGFTMNGRPITVKIPRPDSQTCLRPDRPRRLPRGVRQYPQMTAPTAVGLRTPGRRRHQGTAVHTRGGVGESRHHAVDR